MSSREAVTLPQVSETSPSCEHCRHGLATTAHDLRTPISILAGYIDLLLSRKLGELSAQQMDVLNEMNQSIVRLQNFTDGFLSYYTVQAGAEMNFGEHDLNECITEVFQIWAPQFTKQKVAHYLLLSKDLPRFAFDYYKVQHIISNLLDNALKFTPQGGSVWIETEPHFWNRRLAQTPWVKNDRRKQRVSAPNAARVTISDTGPGIPPEFHQEIFEQFRRLAAAPSNGTGRGIGLSSAKRLVEMHGGKIWVEGDTGQGSKFNFLLPYIPERLE
jgi:signal transduction histidine kinase